MRSALSVTGRRGPDNRRPDTTDEEVNARVGELLALIRGRAGEPEELYGLVTDGEAVRDEVEYEEGSRRAGCCAPRHRRRSWAAAEAAPGLPLPPLLRAVNTRVGNGGFCLGLLGLAAGQPGAEDLFPGQSAVKIYQTLEGWRRDGTLDCLPPGLFPINDGLGCGMVDDLDCRTAGGTVRRSDAGRLTARGSTLWDYLREAVEDDPTSFGRRAD